MQSVLLEYLPFIIIFAIIAIITIIIIMKYLSAVSERCQQVLLLYWWPDSTRGERSQAIIPFTALSNNGFSSWNFFFSFFTNFGFCATVLSETDTLRKCVEDNFLFPEKIWSAFSPQSACDPTKWSTKINMMRRKALQIWNANICLIFQKKNCFNNHTGH